MIYSELIEPHALGNPTIVRGSFVEPDQNGLWWADMSPVRGPRPGPYLMRSRAIDAEIAWLREYWLIVLDVVFTFAPLGDLDTNTNTSIGQQVLGGGVSRLNRQRVSYLSTNSHDM